MKNNIMQQKLVTLFPIDVRKRFDHNFYFFQWQKIVRGLAQAGFRHDPPQRITGKKNKIMYTIALSCGETTAGRTTDLLD